MLINTQAVGFKIKPAAKQSPKEQLEGLRHV